MSLKGAGCDSFGGNLHMNTYEMEIQKWKKKKQMFRKFFYIGLILMLVSGIMFIGVIIRISIILDDPDILAHSQEIETLQYFNIVPTLIGLTGLLLFSMGCHASTRNFMGRWF